MASSPQKFYLQYINEQAGYRATWDPGKPLEIGMIGKLAADGSFIPYSTLQKEGIIPEVLSAVTKTDMDYTSSDKVNISTKLSGDIPAAGSVFTKADAGFDIDFNSEKGIVFKVSGFRTDQITNIGNLQEKILEKYNNGTWDKDLLVVTQLVKTDSATIIISTSSNGKLELKANANVGTGGLKITDASLGLTVANEKGSTIKFIATGDLTPLYNVMGVKDPFFGQQEIVLKGSEEDLLQPAPPLVFSERAFKVEELVDEATDVSSLS